MTKQLQVANTMAKQWLRCKLKDLTNKYMWMYCSEDVLGQHWQNSLDTGAVRTFYYYMVGMPQAAFLFVCVRYHLWFWHEASQTYVARNPSAALVWVLRFTCYEDEDFIAEFLA